MVTKKAKGTLRLNRFEITKYELLWMDRRIKVWFLLDVYYLEFFLQQENLQKFQTIFSESFRLKLIFFIYSHFLKRDIQNDSVKTWIRSNRYALYLLKSRIQMKDVVFPSNLKNSISSGFYIWIDSIWIFKKTKIFILVRLNFFIIFERILLFQTHNLLDYTEEG